MTTHHFRSANSAVLSTYNQESASGKFLVDRVELRETKIVAQATRGEPCSAARRLTALVLGASWLVMLVVACGGGDDDVIATPVAMGTAGSSARAEARAMAATAPNTSAQMPAHAPGHVGATMPAALLQPCSDESRRPAQLAAVPAQLRSPLVQGDGLGDEALNSLAGRLGAGASDTAPASDPFEAKQVAVPIQPFR